LGLGTALGIPYGKFSEKEEIMSGFDTTIVVRYMFFFIGFFLIYLSLGMSRRIDSMYGGGANITKATGTSTMVVMITMVLFLIILVVETLFTILKYLGETRLDNKYGAREI